MFWHYQQHVTVIVNHIEIWKIFSCPLIFFPRSTSNSELRWSFLNVDSSRQHISVKKKNTSLFLFLLLNGHISPSLTGIKICCDIKWCQVTMTREGESEYLYTQLYIYALLWVFLWSKHTCCALHSAHCEASKHTHTLTNTRTTFE